MKKKPINKTQAKKPEKSKGINPEIEALLNKKLKEIQQIDGRQPKFYRDLIVKIWCLTRKEIERLVENENTPMYVLSAINIVNEVVRQNMHATAYFNDIVFCRAQTIGGLKRLGEEDEEDEVLPPVTVFKIPSNGSETIDVDFEKILDEGGEFEEF